MGSQVHMEVPAGCKVRYLDALLPTMSVCMPVGGWAHAELPEAVRRVLDPGCRKLTCYRVPEPPFLPTQGAVVLNACGAVMSEALQPVHRAFRRVSTRFGWEHQLYSTAGNIAIQYSETVFKGARDRAGLLSVCSELFGSETTAWLNLAVVQVRLGLALMVNRCCLLENRMALRPWTLARDRIEETCNTALFGIQDWNGMLRDIGMPPWALPPQSATVSVTRRGVLTARITWAERGMPWDDDSVLEAVNRLAALLRTEL